MDSHYFSQDYAEARNAFCSSSRAAGAEVESYQNPCHGPQQTPLFTDVALLGPSDAENIVLLISGTHGVEGFAGSAVQTGLLLGGLSPWPRSNTRVIMIHALNPYGFASLRRCNEDNVDLNRNFVDHAREYPENPGYHILSEAIAPRSMSLPMNIWSMTKIYTYRLRRGRDKLQQAVTHGQYEYPQGLFYGGRYSTWSNRTLHEISKRHLARAATVVSIDFHTGLGPYGYGELILNEAVGEPAYQRAISWWGNERVASTVEVTSVWAHLSGTINLELARILPGTVVTAVGLEFGTLPPMGVFKALRAENWLHHHGGLHYSGAEKIKKQFLNAFCPDDPLWKHKVWEQGRLVVNQVLSA